MRSGRRRFLFLRGLNDLRWYRLRLSEGSIECVGEPCGVS
jgi:hypothetical protein